MSLKKYSLLAVSIDTILEQFKTRNAIEISELIFSEFGICSTIDQVKSYMDENNIEHEEIKYNSLSNN